MSPLNASAHHSWVCTWLSTSQPTTDEAFPFSLEIPTSLCEQTLYQTLRITLGGNKLRFVFSNRYGSQPLVLGDNAITVTSPLGESWTAPIQFNGQAQVTIPAGQVIYSDEIAHPIADLSEIILLSYFPELTPVETFHWDARHYSQLASGNCVHKAYPNNSMPISSRLLLERVDTQSDTHNQTVVVIGDSMVDGNGVEMNRYHRWVDFLAERAISHKTAVVNAGQSGSRLLKDGIGISTLSRFHRDVIDLEGVTTCIVQVGLNDIGLAQTALAPINCIPTAYELIEGYRQLIRQAHEHHIRVVGVTLVPLRSTEEYGLENFYTPEKEVIRQEVNQWMRNSGEFDAVIDNEQWVRDSQKPQQLALVYDSGDHLHLNYAGHILIANAISLDDIIGI
ncbi:TPA: SGNH/GDSL hydrolase family protein [Providencia alcalifaciens]|uniref:SGNH/GDSL hydrolase family protein n=1 Tax=Providencia alcalifaciens TaxID=126385 RepID=UPI00044F22C7|nr:SGNH/GDSL hydrolase family protein [Providencia alcalifaciens]EUD07840.1 GDSL-like protein [Providencia alcalifaciens R90-1475]MTC31394.1 SGNH/GDSL hydrolase family protein [Providencia alcalifaciens]